MMGGIRALLSDDISSGKHYVHFTILAVQHIHNACAVQSCFYGCTGPLDTVSQGFI